MGGGIVTDGKEGPPVLLSSLPPSLPPPPGVSSCPALGKDFVQVGPSGTAVRLGPRGRGSGWNREGLNFLACHNVQLRPKQNGSAGRPRAQHPPLRDPPTSGHRVSLPAVEPCDGDPRTNSTHSSCSQAPGEADRRGRRARQREGAWLSVCLSRKPRPGSGGAAAPAGTPAPHPHGIGRWKNGSDKETPASSHTGRRGRHGAKVPGVEGKCQGLGGPQRSPSPPSPFFPLSPPGAP